MASVALRRLDRAAAVRALGHWGAARGGMLLSPRTKETSCVRYTARATRPPAPLVGGIL